MYIIPPGTEGITSFRYAITNTSFNYTPSLIQIAFVENGWAESSGSQIPAATKTFRAEGATG